jgi:hypothetical protein
MDFVLVLSQHLIHGQRPFISLVSGCEEAVSLRRSGGRLLHGLEHLLWKRCQDRHSTSEPALLDLYVS